MVVMASLWAGCGDDGAVVTGDDSSSETGTSADTSFTSTDPTSPSTTSTTTDTTTTSPSTTTTADSSGTTTEDPSASSESEASSTGDPIAPLGPPLEQPFDIDFTPLALALADLDGDGVLDLLITGTSKSAVVGATLLGMGNGGFGDPIDAGIGACSAYPITGAIDDDASADLFFGTCLDEPIFYLAAGDGTFVSTEVLDPWLEPPVRSSRFVDHDVDGDDDLVVLTVGNNDPRLHLATQSGDLTWPVTSSSAATSDEGFDPDGLSIARLDDDERGDVLLFDANESLAYMLADDGGYSAAVAIALDLAPTTVTRFDLDDDGLDDLVVGSRTGGTLQIAHNQVPDFDLDDVVDLGGVAPLELAVARWGDGDVHVAVLDAGAAGVHVLESDGAGGLAFVDSIPLPSLALRLLHGDLNGDGSTDLVAATFAAGSITVLLGN